MPFAKITITIRGGTRIWGRGRAPHIKIDGQFSNNFSNIKNFTVCNFKDFLQMGCPPSPDPRLTIHVICTIKWSKNESLKKYHASN
jgi:hypothetical protein